MTNQITRMRQKKTEGGKGTAPIEGVNQINLDEDLITRTHPTNCDIYTNLDGSRSQEPIDGVTIHGKTEFIRTRMRKPKTER